MSEIHRNTLARLAVVDVIARNATAAGDSTSVGPNVCGNMDIADLLNPNPATLRRLKTASNLSLRLRLCATEAFDLPTLLKVVSADRWKNPLETKSLPLLSPEGLPYHGPLFHACSRPQFRGNMPSCRQDVSACNMNGELRPIREVLELPSLQMFIPVLSYR